MVLKLPQQSAHKPAAVRRIVVTVPDYSRADGARRGAGSSILEKKERIKRLAADTLGKLEQETGFPYPPISVDIQRRPVAKASLVEIVEAFSDQTLRALADFADTDLDAKGPDLHDLGLSHLISIRPDCAPSGWNSTPGISDTIVCTNTERIPYLIVDVLLDISAFYSWHYLVERFSESVEERHALSRKKAQFALKHSLSSFYGPINNEDVTYFSFAAACRKDRNFGRNECRRFEDLWRDFIGEQLSESIPSARRRFIPKDTAVTYIKKYHEKAGGLSEKKLASQIAPLTTGSYVLVRVESWPKREKTKHQIRSLIGGSSRRRGHFGIFTNEQAKAFLRHSRYLSFFSFQISAGAQED